MKSRAETCFSCIAHTASPTTHPNLVHRTLDYLLREPARHVRRLLCRFRTPRYLGKGALLFQ